MKIRVLAMFLCPLFVASAFLGVGYAALTDDLSVTGEGSLDAPAGVYISYITPTSSAGVQVTGTSGTVLSASVTGRGTASFTVTVTNTSDVTYVYERLIEGAEMGVEGVYNGTDIDCSVGGISSLDEVASGGGTRSFTLTVTVPSGVVTDNFVLLFNFVEKGTAEILPDGTEYEVVFKPGNGDADTTARVAEGKTVPRPADPVWDGYTFTGWYKDINGAVAWDFAKDTVQSNTVLHAGWTPNEAPPDEPEPPPVVQYEVIFKYNNGAPDQTVVVNEGALLSKPADPTRDGYTFTGWFKDVACTSAWNFATERVGLSVTLYAGWRDNNASDETPELKGDFAGLVEAILLPETNNSLNNSSVIYNAIRQAMNSNKRPKEDAPILHCSVNSISGSTMTDVAEQANAKLTKELQFFFEGDPNNSNKLYLYMYYAEDCTEDKEGQEITVYKQVLSRDADGTWNEDGTYLGRATVGYFYGGGNNGKDVLTVNAYSWKAGALAASETE